MLLTSSHWVCLVQADKYSQAHGGKIRLFRFGIMAQANSWRMYLLIIMAAWYYAKLFNLSYVLKNMSYIDYFEIWMCSRITLCEFHESSPLIPEKNLKVTWHTYYEWEVVKGFGNRCSHEPTSRSIMLLQEVKIKNKSYWLLCAKLLAITCSMYCVLRTTVPKSSWPLLVTACQSNLKWCTGIICDVPMF